MADAYQLGYVEEPYSIDHEMYRGRLSIPYLTRAGVVTIRFRCIEEHDCKAVNCVKYLGLPKLEMPLYNVSSLFRAREVIVICEGELDALVCSSMVGVPAVGCPGASAWKPHFSLCVDDYPTVLVCGDGDEAGAAFVARVSDAVNRARGVSFPHGEDLNSWYQKHGRAGVLTVLGLSVNT